jgi:hypothetical protein
MAFFFVTYCVVLKMKVGGSPDTSQSFHQTARLYITEDSRFHNPAVLFGLITILKMSLVLIHFPYTWLSNLKKCYSAYKINFLSILPTLRLCLS